MSEQPPTPAQDPAGTPDPAAPRPEPIRWFGTSWVHRDHGYWARRVAVSAGSLVTAAAAAFVLRLAVEGVALSAQGGFLNTLLVLAVAVCSLLAALRTWKVFAEGRDGLTGWMAEDRSLGAVWMIGGVGSLLAYFLRSLTEAPGEGVLRARYERAVEQYEKRRAGRGGRPGGKRRR
ncbi:EamA/RhaT family transporter [Kitasatospora sp. NPDC093558]|uniref:EamA/RhaT family transporter n=1 Tax=Kitasatospora sp. NPDC093558 TaxID=3155201 RepID=UPI0034124501